MLLDRVSNADEYAYIDDDKEYYAPYQPQRHHQHQHHRPRSSTGSYRLTLNSGDNVQSAQDSWLSQSLRALHAAKWSRIVPWLITLAFATSSVWSAYSTAAYGTGTSTLVSFAATALRHNDALQPGRASPNESRCGTRDVLDARRNAQFWVTEITSNRECNAQAM